VKTMHSRRQACIVLYKGNLGTLHNNTEEHQTEFHKFKITGTKHTASH